MFFSLFTSCTKDGLCSGKSHGILCYFMHRLLSLCTISPQHDNHQVRRSVKKKILHPTYSLTCQQKTVARTPIAITDHAIRPSSVTRNRIETKQLQLHTKVERKRSSKKKNPCIACSKHEKYTYTLEGICLASAAESWSQAMLMQRGWPLKR